VNIAKAMGALAIADLDHTAKMAVHVLACHADQHTASATITIECIATELSRAYGTTWRALNRAVEAGYVVAQPVDRHPNKARTWVLTSRVDARPRSRDFDKEVARSQPKGRAPARDRRIFKEKREGERTGAIARHPASAGAVDKAPPDVAPAPPHVRTNGLAAARQALKR
jgi:hypothetical protein